MRSLSSSTFEDQLLFCRVDEERLSDSFEIFSFEEAVDDADLVDEISLPLDGVDLVVSRRVGKGHGGG